MFLIRKLYFDQLPFLVNGIFWSIICFIIATWRIKARGMKWQDLGLTKPKSIPKTIAFSLLTFGAVLVSMIAFEIIKDSLPSSLPEDTSANDSRFEFLKGSYLMLLTILPIVWLESFFEEALDRGFLINWFEKVLPGSIASTVIAVILQAAIFGFRHSYDLSMRSLSVAIIGLVMGIAYVAFGRNLWPVIIAHCILNTVSMVDRV